MGGQYHWNLHSINDDDLKKPTIKDIAENIIAREIHIQEEGIEFNSILFLPKKQYNFELEGWRFNSLIIGASNNLSIDGIIIELDGLHGHHYTDESYFLSMLNNNGNLNFTGEIRPLISIDRKSIISYPDECNVLAEKIMQTYTNQIIDIAVEHIISELFFNDRDALEDICDYFLSKINLEKGYKLFIDKIRHSDIGDCDLGSLNNAIDEPLTIRSFLDAEIVRFKTLNFSNYNRFVKYLLKYKFDNSSKIDVEDNIIIIYTDRSNENDRENNESIDDVAGLGDLAYKTTLWNPFNSDYDIITNLYPLLPSKLYNLLDYAEVKAPALKKFVPYRYSSLMDVFSLNPFSVTINMEIDNERLYSKEVFQMYNLKNTSGAMSFSEIINENELQKIVLMVFVSPHPINNEQKIAIDYYKDRDPDYVKGIVEGWSILFTTVEKQNFVILPGKVSRDELVDKLSQEFWDEYDEFEFIFTDGSVMKKITLVTDDIL
ncbi:hypothetical protein [Chryseobacterium sp. Leaf405]|uniref:hypothetical protein n=1 Tax=Chryseobacterium sp. Leaf405 TaxID=1736367 RepID=UPI000B32ECCE|nr:hypothetical protein [Chryseobacterium sp. Leaf405]